VATGGGRSGVSATGQDHEAEAQARQGRGIEGGGVLIKEKLYKNDFRFVEKLLYDYKTHDTAIAETEAEIQKILSNLYPSATASFVNLAEPKGEMDSQPEAWTIKRDENLRIKYLRGRIAERKRHQKAIKEARESLDDLENQLVRLFYDLDKTARDCCRTIGLQKSRFYEIREKIVHKVAKFIGLL
jgi:DNA-directed RNA polymerase specialized sigma subunit